MEAYDDMMTRQNQLVPTVHVRTYTARMVQRTQRSEKHIYSQYNSQARRRHGPVRQVGSESNTIVRCTTMTDCEYSGCFSGVTEEQRICCFKLLAGLQIRNCTCMCQQQQLSAYAKERVYTPNVMYKDQWTGEKVWVKLAGDETGFQIFCFFCAAPG